MWWSIFQKVWLFGKVSPQHLLSCWKWRWSPSKKNNWQFLLSEDPRTCCPVKSGRGTTCLFCQISNENNKLQSFNFNGLYLNEHWYLCTFDLVRAVVSIHSCRVCNMSMVELHLVLCCTARQSNNMPELGEWQLKKSRRNDSKQFPRFFVYSLLIS